MYAAKKQDLNVMVEKLALRLLEVDPVGSIDLISQAAALHAKVNKVVTQRAAEIRFPIGVKVIRPNAVQRHHKGMWTVVGYRGDKVRIKKGHICENIGLDRILRADVEPVEALVPEQWRVRMPQPLTVGVPGK